MEYPFEESRKTFLHPKSRTAEGVPPLLKNLDRQLGRRVKVHVYGHDHTDLEANALAEAGGFFPGEDLEVVKDYEVYRVTRGHAPSTLEEAAGRAWKAEVVVRVIEKPERFAVSRLGEYWAVVDHESLDQYGSPTIVRRYPSGIESMYAAVRTAQEFNTHDPDETPSEPYEVYHDGGNWVVRDALTKKPTHHVYQDNAVGETAARDKATYLSRRADAQDTVPDIDAAQSDH